MADNEPTNALERHVELMRSVQGALMDACVLVDIESRVVAFNRSFFMLFPRRQARNLEGSVFGDVLELRWNGGLLNPIRACIDRGGAVRFDEIEGHGPDGRQFHFIVSAAPVRQDGAPMGAWLMLRDVTDEVQMQSKYQNMLQDETRSRAELAHELAQRTEELSRAQTELNELQSEVVEYAKGLRLPGNGRLMMAPAADDKAQG